MKKILQLIILGIILLIILIKTPFVSYVSGVIYSSPCDIPISYKIDFVDPRFHLSQQEFLSDVQEAANIWDQAVGKNLFSYDQKDDSLSINMIFDERQSLTNQIGNLENQLSTEKNNINPQMSNYNSLSADFKSRLNSLNQQIDYWNSKGGAPPDVYTKLKNEQQSLQQEADKLNSMAKSLNQSTYQYNLDVGQLNQTVNNYNNALTLRPEEGVYDPKNNRINIYFNISHNELVHTLAHELGHSLGLQHNNNQNSIMYPQTTKALIPSSNDLSDLEKVCQKRTIFDRISDALAIIQNHGSIPLR